MAAQPKLALRVVDGCHEPAKLVANSQLLKYITHPNLAQYIDVVQGRASRLGVVCEHYELHLAGFLRHHYSGGLPQEQVWGCAAQLLSAVATIHEQGLVHHRLSSSSVLVCHGGGNAATATCNSSDAPTLKLADWGFHHLTAGGTLASCSAGNPRYISPEIVVAGPSRTTATGTTGAQRTQTVSTNGGEGADIWAVGILLVELILGDLPNPLGGSESTADLLQGVLDIARARARARAQHHVQDLGSAGSQVNAQTSDDPGPGILWPGTVSTQFCTVDESLRTLVNQCLEPLCTHRQDARSLLHAHEKLARHLSTININACETDRGYLGLRSIPTVPPPPPVPIQGAAATQTAARRMPAPEAAASTRVAAIRRLSERFFEWVAQHGGDTDAVDRLIDDAIDVKKSCESQGRSATLQPSRSTPRARLPIPLYSFPMITLRDRSYSVAVPVAARDAAEDVERLDHRTSRSAFDQNHMGAFPLPFLAAEDGDTESLTSDEIGQQPTIAAAVDGASLRAELRTSASTEPQKLSVIPSRHPLWDGCSPQERQQLRVAVIADADLPVPLRERHRAYQAARVAQFRALMEKLPGARHEIVRESKIDIPPALRAEIWPILLGLSADSLDSKDMLAPICSPVSGSRRVLDEQTRKQIDVDLPRCHQENPILASAEGQTCLRLVLEAWLETYAQSNDYCQGLDSLAAPFVTMFFHRYCGGVAETGLGQLFNSADPWESQPHEQTDPECSQHKKASMRLAVQPAYCCLVAFTGRFLDQIFASGSTSMLRAQLAEFSEILSAELPQLASHFCAEGVTVELFAIPWLLTLFAHVLPLPNILQLWDVLLAYWDEPCVESLPLYVATSILRQSEAQLLALDFNGILLHLSRLPPINLDSALRDAVVNWSARSTADAG